MKAKKKSLLTDRLVSLGLLADTKQAKAFMLAGKIYVNGQRATPGMKVSVDDEITIPGLNDRYTSKGGWKLEKALQDFALSPKGRVCIDAGASTGGFTDCLLKHGAAKVYAVDVGFGQLHGSLRQDARVANLEKTNIGDEKLHHLSPAPDFGTCDLSYLSLVLGVPQFQKVMRSAGDLVCLVKPLFEIEDAVARRTGQIADDQYAPMLEQLKETLEQAPDTSVVGITNSPVTGNQGTVEFFFHVVFGSKQSVDVSDQIQSSVQQALQLAPYRKE